MIKTLHRSSKSHSRCSNRAVLRESALCCSGRSAQSGSKPKMVKNNRNAPASSIYSLSGGRHCSANPELQPAVVPNAGAVAMVTWQAPCVQQRVYLRAALEKKKYHHLSVFTKVVRKECWKKESSADLRVFVRLPTLPTFIHISLCRSGVKLTRWWRNR